jgi:hypothetical protein
MFAGQMACEALNWVLKRYIKEERPRGKSRKGHYSSVVLILDRDAWKGLRNAFLTRPVRILLLRYLRPVSPLPTRSPPDGYPHALLTGWPFPPFTPSIGLCRSCSCKQDIFELSYTKTSCGRMCCRSYLRPGLVRLHNISAESWLDRVGSRNLGLENTACKRSCDTRRPG